MQDSYDGMKLLSQYLHVLQAIVLSYNLSTTKFHTQHPRKYVDGYKDMYLSFA